MIDGLAVVDKPAGMTSHDVVARCRRLFGQKKVGHAGTLDPDATGVLLVGLGRATRLLQFQTGLPKCYSAEVVLGVATTTLDAAGDVTGRWDQRHVTIEDARRAAAQFTGPIWQVPPMVSAVKVGGRRLHELARQGLEVERAARLVTVSRFSVEVCSTAGEARGGGPGRGPGEGEGDARGGGPGRGPGEGVAGGGGPRSGPVLVVRVECSSGTYVRVLAADLGAALGGGAHLRHLRRTAVGPWTEAMATELEALSPANVMAPSASLPWLDEVAVDADRAGEVGNGRVLAPGDLGVSGDGPWRVIGPRGDLLAIYQRVDRDLVKPIVVMAPAVP